MGMEVEIKLTGAAADVLALRDSRLFSGRRAGRRRHERLVATYYDTPSGDLEAAGVTLRVREEDGVRIQTVKKAGAGGSTFARLEEERALAPGEPAPAHVSDALLGAHLAPYAADLAPTARTVVDRWSVEIDGDDALVEAAFDVGRAEALVDGVVIAAAPIAECELELIEGDAEAAFALAHRAVDRAGGRLRIGAASKAEQARRLVRKAGPVGPEQPLVLGADDSAADAFAAALAATAHRLADCQSALLDARAPEGVHQMRVALRRLRAVERIFRKSVRSRTTRRLAERARNFASRLGPARDWDVFCDATLPAIADDLGGSEGLRSLAAAAASRRAEAAEAAANAVAATEFSHFILDLQEASLTRAFARKARGALGDPAKSFARTALDKRLARLARDAARVDEDAEARHAIRIEIKKLRYACQLFRTLFKGRGRKAYIAALGRLQDRFGALNDAGVAGRLALEAAEDAGPLAARAAGVVAGCRARIAEEAVADSSDELAAFLALDPFWRKAAERRRAANDAG